MSNWGFRTGLHGDTLVALQQRQLALEAQMKQGAKAAASRVIKRHSKKKEWPEGDLEEVLGALGLPHESS